MEFLKLNVCYNIAVTTIQEKKSFISLLCNYKNEWFLNKNCGDILFSQEFRAKQSFGTRYCIYIIKTV